MATTAQSRAPHDAMPERLRPASLEEAAAARDAAVDFWQDWPATAKVPDHPWKPYIDRSAPHAEGAQLRPRRRGHGGGDNLAAGNAGRDAFGSYRQARPAQTRIQSTAGIIRCKRLRHLTPPGVIA